MYLQYQNENLHFPESFCLNRLSSSGHFSFERLLAFIFVRANNNGDCPTCYSACNHHHHRLCPSNRAFAASFRFFLPFLGVGLRLRQNTYLTRSPLAALLLLLLLSAIRTIIVIENFLCLAFFKNKSPSTVVTVVFVRAVILNLIN